MADSKLCDPCLQFRQGHISPHPCSNSAKLFRCQLCKQRKAVKAFCRDHDVFIGTCCYEDHNEILPWKNHRLIIDEESSLYEVNIDSYHGVFPHCEQCNCFVNRRSIDYHMSLGHKIGTLNDHRYKCLKILIELCKQCEKDIFKFGTDIREAISSTAITRRFHDTSFLSIQEKLYAVTSKEESGTVSQIRIMKSKLLYLQDLKLFIDNLKRCQNLNTVVIFTLIIKQMLEHPEIPCIPDRPNTRDDQTVLYVRNDEEFRSAAGHQIMVCTEDSDVQSASPGGENMRTEDLTVVHVSSDEEAEIAPPTPPLQTSQITNVDPGEEVIAGYVTAGTPTVLISTSTSRRELIDVTREIGLNGTDMNNFIPDNVANFGDSGPNSSIGSLKEKLMEHRENFINTASEQEDQLLLEVRRQFVLSDSLSLIRHSRDNLHRPLHIKFTEEYGIDLGGLRREFWSLFCHQLTHSSFVTGKPNRLTFQANFIEKKKNNFFYLGQLVALSIIQDGAGLPIFADIVTDYILNGELSPILNEDDLLDHLKDVIEKMQNSSNDGQLKEEYAKIIDAGFEAGFVIPSSAFKRAHINPLKAALVEHLVTGCKDELDQFIQGLKTHQVLDLLRLPENRAEARCLFSGRLPPITTNKLRELIKFNYSEGNRKLQELATAQGFLTFLMSTQGNTNVTDEVKIQTKDVVMWLTGSNIIPAVGFHKLIDVEFGDRTFVNTCALTLTLKLQPNLALDDAVDYYTDLIINGQTFSME